MLKRAGVMFTLLLVGCSSGGTGNGGKSDAAADASWLTGGAAASCVEQFSVENLAGSSWAFDGTIAEVVPPKDLESDKPEDIQTTVTFDVSHWYTGASGQTVTLKTYNTPGTVGQEGGPDPSIGARLLVSGEDVYIWGCGFTKPYTEDNAKLFERAFEG